VEAARSGLSRTENGRVEVSLDSSLEEVWLDPIQISQVLHNLLDNALKYSPADSKVKLQVLGEGGSLIFEVLDRSSGLPPGEEERVFERFYRAPELRESAVPGVGVELVEGAERQKTPNEIALNIRLAGLTIIFLLAVATLLPFSLYSVRAPGSGRAPDIFALVSLLVCLIPTTIGGLLSAIGTAGMDRVMQHNVLAMSGKAVEAAGDVNTLLLDKTGTITLGNRQAVEFLPAPGVTERELADAAQLSSLADETPEGRSIVVLAKEKYNIRERQLAAHEAEFIFTVPLHPPDSRLKESENHGRSKHSDH
jgi:hypothetical protein